MSSTIQPVSNPANAAQSAPVASSSTSGTTSPSGPGSQPTARSYASATKKTFSPPPIASSSPPVAVGGSAPTQHGKSNSISPVNGKQNIQPAVPTAAPPSIVNGAPSPSDHSRKPSNVTISAPGTSGTVPNGSALGPNRGPPPVFGQMPNGSPAPQHAIPNHPRQSSLATPLSNPRITSPATSPSPIPQPAASGGRPPSLGGPGPGLNFGSTGGEGDSNPRPVSMPPGPAVPQAQHLRRESSQSAHSDMGNPAIAGMGRGFPPNGRGRGFTPSYPPHMGSPGQYNRMPNQRGGAVPQQFQGQVPMGAVPGSPYRQARSPAMTPATMQQQAQIVHGQPMHQQPYPGYPSHLGPNNQGYYGQYDPSTAYFYGQPQYMHPGMQFPGAPPSPRFGNTMPHVAQQQYMPSQYGGMPGGQGMSRTPSQASERPSSAIAQPATPGMSAVNHAAHGSTASSSSPAPPSSNPNFQLPPKAKSGIVIKNADGEVITFDKKSASPAPAPRPSQSPVVVSSTPTPPPRVPSSNDNRHSRSQSVQSKSDAEKKHDFQAEIKRKMEEAKLAEERKKAEEENKASKEKEEAEAKAAKEKEEAEKKAAEEKEAAEKAAKAEEEEKSKKAAEEQERLKKEEEERLKKEEDERLEREIAEMEELERQEEERERQYQENKKQKEAEEAKLAAAKLDEEMKAAERKAEEEEERRAKAKPEEDESPEAKAEREKLFSQLKRPTFGPGAQLASSTSGASTPASDASMPPPAQPVRAASGKPKPAALKLETNKPVEPAQPTAGMQSLKSARFLAIRSEAINYPEGVKSPNPALNQGGKSKGRQYDKDFLLQFQQIFKEKPSVDWETKVKETVGDSDSARPQSARTPSMMGGRQGSRPGMPPSGLSQGTMGMFSSGGRTLPPGTTSHERFLASSQSGAGPRPTMSNPLASFANRPGGFPMGGQPTPMARQASFQGMGQGPNSPRVGSSRGKGSRRDQGRSGSRREEEQAAKTMPLTAGMELKPLEKSQAGWKPTSISAPQTAQVLPGTHMPPDLVQRKVKAALNKMTPEKFDRIADQILEIAAQSKDESDGRTLRQVIQLTFEKACDEAHWASMYAKFCKRMLETMSPDIKDENVTDKNGNPVVGGNLFRKYLLNRCQEEFERGWEVNLPDKPEGESEEAVMLSDEYYIAAAAKRKGLGLIQFIGELYKLNMLTLRIMHECVLKLLNFEGPPDESAIESLTKLLKTVGATMEATEQGPGMLTVYFERVKKIDTENKLPSRMHFMLVDLIELRGKGWRSKEGEKGPKTIQEIHAEAAAAQARAEAERARQNQRGGGRPPPGRGDVRSASGGFMPPPDYNRNQLGMDDLRRLSRNASGRSGAQGPATFGPSSLLGGRSGSGRKGLGPSALSRGGEDSGASSRTATPPRNPETPAHHQNTFSALAGLDASGEDADHGASPPSTTSSPPVSKTLPARTRSKSPAVDKKEETTT